MSVIKSVEITQDERENRRIILSNIAKKISLANENTLLKAAEELTDLGIEPTPRYSLRQIAIVMYLKTVEDMKYEKIVKAMNEQHGVENGSMGMLNNLLRNIGAVVAYDRGSKEYLEQRSQISSKAHSEDGKKTKLTPEELVQVQEAFLRRAWEVEPINKRGISVDVAAPASARKACHWPMSDLRSNFLTVCGNPTHGETYCSGHNAMAYQPRNTDPYKQAKKQDRFLIKASIEGM